MVQLCDTLTLDRSARICADGSLVAEVFAARTGTQDYLGREVDPDNTHGLRDKAIVTVYRPEAEVFKADSLATFAAAPVTVNHPTEAVDAANWRELGVGEINGDVVRDGQRVRVPIIVRDAKAVKAATSTHKQLSMGYATELVFPKDGKHPDGTACDAYQTNIKINHIALVPAARGGPELRVVDERTAPSTEGKAMKKIVLDGLQVDLSDADAVAAAFDKLQAKANDAATALADANGKVETLTGEKAALQTQLDEAKAASDPAKLDQLAADRAALIVAAKSVKADIVTDGKSAEDIRKEVVAAKLGDKAPTSDAAIEGAFAVLTSDADTKVHTFTPAVAIADSGQSIRDAALAARNRHAVQGN